MTHQDGNLDFKNSFQFFTSEKGIIFLLTEVLSSLNKKVVLSFGDQVSDPRKWKDLLQQLLSGNHMSQQSNFGFSKKKNKTSENNVNFNNYVVLSFGDQVSDPSKWKALLQQ